MSNLGMLSSAEFGLNYNLQALCCTQRWFKQHNQVKLRARFSWPKSISDDTPSHRQACFRKSSTFPLTNGNKSISFITPSGNRSIISASSSYEYAEEQVPYEVSRFAALVVPAGWLAAFCALLKGAMIVAPSTITPYYEQMCISALIISYVWFLIRWGKRMPAQSVAYREKLITLYFSSWFGLYALALVALAKAFGVIVAAIGGVVIAYGVYAYLLSIPIKDVEGGLTTSESLNAEESPVLVTRICVQSGDSDKILVISDKIKTMLRSHDNVSQGKEVPYCFPSHIESSCAELIVGYNLKHMSKDKEYAVQQDILLEAVEIINKHDARITKAAGQSRAPTNVK